MTFVNFGWRCLLLLALASPVSAHPNDKSRGRTLTFTAINLRWFGLGTETRVESIKEYLATNRLLADVMVLEEVVDLTMLERDVLGRDYACHSYDRSDSRHQHVVLCNKTTYELAMADGATSYALDTVDTSGRLRPAVHGVLKTRAGERLVHVFGVHLKAMPEASAIRLTQVEKLTDYVAANRSGDRVIVLGDFNTFASDPDDMEAIFDRVAMTEVELPEPFTWASSSEDYPPAKFDRVWLSDELHSAVDDAHVVGPCSSGDDSLIRLYNDEVSDHCAITLSIER